MNAEQLKRIRLRCGIPISSNDPSSWFQVAHADRVALLKLVDELTEQCGYYEAMKTGVMQRIEDLEKQNGRLRDEQRDEHAAIYFAGMMDHE